MEILFVKKMYVHSEKFVRFVGVDMGEKVDTHPKYLISFLFPQHFSFALKLISTTN